MASSEPIPLYFFRRMPSEKKYSPGASDVAASNDPIITEGETKSRREFSFNYDFSLILKI